MVSDANLKKKKVKSGKLAYVQEMYTAAIKSCLLIRPLEVAPTAIQPFFSTTVKASVASVDDPCHAQFGPCTLDNK